MTARDAAGAMCDGNPGALTVMMAMLTRGDEIDPGSFAGGLLAILSMDTRGIYGSRIWMLYKDVCGEDLVDTMALIRAVQLGILSGAQLDHAIDHYGEGIEVESTVAAVKATLSRFGLVSE